MSQDKAPRRSKAQPELDVAAGEYGIYALEEQEEKKFARIAWGVAIVIHALLFFLNFPDIQVQASEREKQKVYVVQQVRFRPPPPQQQQEIPKPKAKKVPIPDPTPDEPEPIRLEDEIEEDFDIPTDDIAFDIPEAPPERYSGPIRVGGEVAAPNKLHAPPPVYTEIARKARIQGIVIVEAIIDKQGNVTNVKVLKGLPMGLDQAAVDAVKKWKFEPATLPDGRPVDVIYTLTVNFQMQ